MHCTDWYPPQQFPLEKRVGEYETLENGRALKRWWNGKHWSMAYEAGDTPQAIDANRAIRSSEAVTWRGRSHRFLKLQVVKYGKTRCTIVDLRPDEQGWAYLLASSTWIEPIWVLESAIRRDKLTARNRFKLAAVA